MKKILNLILVVVMCIGVSACSKKNETVIPKADDKEANTSKVYGKGEEMIMLDDNGKEMYSLRIDNIKTDNNYIYKSENNYDDLEQVIAVTYTYKNIGKDDERLVEITADALLLSDMEGELALASSMYMKGLPKPIPVGTSLTLECHFGLKNKTDKVKINFVSEMYKKNGTVVFEIPVE